MKYVKKYIYIISLIIFLIISTYIIIIKINLNKNENKDIVIEEKPEEDTSHETLIPEICNIDIKGAIKNPGVYKIDCNNTVNDVIKIAGGLLETSDTSVINLAKKISNEMVIIIYTKEEVKNSNVVDTVIKYIDKECNCPNIKNDGCINDKIENTIGSNKININTATLEDLEKISGIGTSKAKSIIEYRNKNGNYKSIEDLLNVSGIGENLYNQIKDYIEI